MSKVGYKQPPEDKQFQPGQSGNPQGRPPRLVTGLIKELTEAGYERVTATTVVEAYEILTGLPEEELKARINNKEEPMIVRIVGKAMLSPKGFEILERMLDRAHGKAAQPIKVDDQRKEILERYGLPYAAQAKKAESGSSGDSA